MNSELAQAASLEPLDIAEVTQLPELSGGGEDPSGFAGMVLTSLLAYESAVLWAECIPGTGPSAVSWRLRPHGLEEEIEIALSPTIESFAAVLDCFARQFTDGQRIGCALRFLRQRGRSNRCHIFLTNAPDPGYWVRIVSARRPLLCQ